MCSKIPKSLCDLEWFIDDWLKKLVIEEAVENGEDYVENLEDALEWDPRKFERLKTIARYEPERTYNNLWKWYDDDYEMYEDYHLYDKFMTDMFGQVLPLSFNICMEMVKELDGDGISILEDYNILDMNDKNIFATYINNKLTTEIIDEVDEELLDCHIDAQNEYEEAALVITKAWKKCRYNPKYKMCWKVQLRDLEENCGMTFNEAGTMVQVC